MSNIVKDIRYDVTDRIGTNFNPGAILRAMNRVYKEINLDLLCIEDTLEIPAGSFSDTVKTYAIPSNIIKIFNIVPSTTSLYTLTYIPKERWNANQYLNCDVFTILDGKLVFGNVSATSMFILYYYSTGLELVDVRDSTLGVEVLTNGDMEIYGGDPWWGQNVSRGMETTTIESGIYSLKLTATGVNPLVYQAISLAIGRKYKIIGHGYMKTGEYGDANISLKIGNAIDDNSDYGIDLSAIDGWYTDGLPNINEIFTAVTGETAYVSLLVKGGSVGDIIYYDSISLKETEATFNSDTQINTPEWDERFWPLLLYETCFELVPDYPLIKQDKIKAAELRTLLRKANKNLQGVSPTILGGAGRYPRKRDPDYVNGLWVTR